MKQTEFGSNLDESSNSKKVKGSEIDRLNQEIANLKTMVEIKSLKSELANLKSLTSKEKKTRKTKKK